MPTSIRVTGSSRTFKREQDALSFVIQQCATSAAPPLPKVAIYRESEGYETAPFHVTLEKGWILDDPFFTITAGNYPCKVYMSESVAESLELI